MVPRNSGNSLKLVCDKHKVWAFASLVAGLTRTNASFDTIWIGEEDARSGTIGMLLCRACPSHALSGCTTASARYPHNSRCGSIVCLLVDATAMQGSSHGLCGGSKNKLYVRWNYLCYKCTMPVKTKAATSNI